MNRRTLLLAAFAAISSSVAGCLENGDFTANSNDSEDNDGSGDTKMNNSSNSGREDDDQITRSSSHDSEKIHETCFEVLDSDYEFERSASVMFENETVAITGTIPGNNSCYNARLGQVAIENQTLTVNIESYDNADEDEVCGEAPIGIKYETVVKFDSDPPMEVIVEHNGEKVRTEQPS